VVFHNWEGLVHQPVVKGEPKSCPRLHPAARSGPAHPLPTAIGHCIDYRRPVVSKVCARREALAARPHSTHYVLTAQGFRWRIPRTGQLTCRAPESAAGLQL